MKLKLNKKTIKNLSKDNKVLPAELTPIAAGGGEPAPKTAETCYNCASHDTRCGWTKG